MRLLLAVVAVMALTGCGGGSMDGPVKTAIVGAKLVDGNGGAPVEYSIVIVEGSIIQAAGAQTSVPFPKDATIVDGMGKTIEPAAAGGRILAGQPANLILKGGDSVRTMREGAWLK